MSGNIIIATSKIKACEKFYELCDYCGYDKDWTDALWGDIIADDEMFAELTYYLAHHTLKPDRPVCVPDGQVQSHKRDR